jgi:hypothetical protein
LNRHAPSERLASGGKARISTRDPSLKHLARQAPQRAASLRGARNDEVMIHLRPLLPWLLLLAFGTLHYSLQLRQQPRGVIRFRVIPQPTPQPRPALQPEAPLI